MSLRPGDAVEHFVIVSSLGEGGMGQVYLARDTRLQRSIALKIMQPEAEGEPSGSGTSNGAARLLREAQSAAGLEHPNVVTIYEVGEIKGEGEEAGRPFIAMELVKGKALRAFVGDERIAMKERVRWLVDTARALAAAHKAGLVHRDIKPENVMVRDDGVVKVLDFGLAKRAAMGTASVSSSTEAQVLPSLTGKGIAIGTPYYMAPEQMRREPLDGRADQFAWGVVAYELLSGEPPWGRDVDALELVSKLLSEDPAPLTQVRPDLPAHVAAAVTRAMSKRKGARFDTMDDLIAALEDASGAFLPTMPRIAVSEPDAGEVAGVPSARLRTTGSVRPPARSRKPWLFVSAGVVVAAAVALVAASKRTTPAPASSASASVAPPHECARNGECVAKLGGKPAVCNARGKCAAIESEDCKARVDAFALSSDDTVWFGDLYPVSGSMAAMGADNDRAADLGRQDFAEASSALRASNRRVRPLALVSCDDAVDPGRAARHLVDLGVPAIIGFKSGDELAELAGSFLAPNHVLAIASMTTSPLATQIPHGADEPPLVWRTTYSGSLAMDDLAKLVESVVEPQLRAEGVERTRIALVRVKSAGALALAERLFGSLRFNGKTALENGADYRDFVFDLAAPSSEPFGAGVDRLRKFAPHVVVYMGGESIVANVLAPLERGWPARQHARPRFLSVSQFGDAEFAIAGRDASRRRRFFGLALPATTSANARFTMHFNEVHRTELARADAPNVDYDAFYLAAYATMALGESAPTGPNLARAIARLVKGPEVEVGPSGILQAFSRLSAGESIELVGAAGRFAFDLGTGEREADLAVLCIDVDETGMAVASVESGLVFRARSEQPIGKMRCP